MADITPIDYGLNVQTPFQAAMQGYSAGAAIRDDQAQQQAKQQAVLAQQQMQQDIGSVMRNPGASASDFAALTLKYPALKDQFKQANDMLSSDQKQNFMSHGTQVYAALANGQPDIAKQLLDQRAASMRNSGDMQGAQASEMMSKAIDVSPPLARNMIALKLNGLDDKFATNVAALDKNAREQALAPADLAIKRAEAGIKGAEAGVAPIKVATDIANTESQIKERATRLGLDRDKLTSDVQLALQKMQNEQGQLPEDVRKDINTSTTDAIAAQQSASKMTDLADRLEREGGGYGGFSTAGEWFKGATGNQNEMTRIRAEYNRIVTPAAMSAYKQVASGSTSDKDIQTAMTGVPSDTADAATMARFLRGVAKLQIYDSVLNNAKSEWLGAVRSLGKAKADIEVDGVKVPAGTSFKEFSDSYVGRKVADRTNSATINASPYAQWATAPVPVAPTAPAVPVYGD